MTNTKRREGWHVKVRASLSPASSPEISHRGRCRNRT